MFGISSTEFAIILIFALLLFGPDKLPQMGRTIGRALRQFKETQEKLTAVVQTEVVDPMTEAATTPTKPKKSADDADASADTDSDADVERVEGAEPHRSETFAERRARLAAEKEQAEAEAAGVTDAATTAAAAVAVDDEDDAASSDESVADSDEAEPQVRTTQDLYARRPRKTKPAATEPEPAVDPFSADVPVMPGDSDASGQNDEGGEQ